MMCLQITQVFGPRCASSRRTDLWDQHGEPVGIVAATCSCPGWAPAIRAGHILRHEPLWAIAGNSSLALLSSVYHHWWCVCVAAIIVG
jgi:hypothetical protein